jgi:hypothetical protein
MSAITASTLELEQVKAELEAWRSEQSGHKFHLGEILS